MRPMRRRLPSKSHYNHLNMNRFQIFVTTVVLILCSINIRAQVESKIISGEKAWYAVGEEFTIQFKLNVDPKSCKDGMEKTAIYSSGVKITSRSEWTELQKGLWQITLKCLVTGNKKGVGQLTVMRKTDKQDLFEQVKFNIRKDVDISK